MEEQPKHQWSPPRLHIQVQVKPQLPAALQPQRQVQPRMELRQELSPRRMPQPQLFRSPSPVEAGPSAQPYAAQPTPPPRPPAQPRPRPRTLSQQPPLDMQASVQLQDKPQHLRANIEANRPLEDCQPEAQAQTQVIVNGVQALPQDLYVPSWQALVSTQATGPQILEPQAPASTAPAPSVDSQLFPPPQSESSTAVLLASSVPAQLTAHRQDLMQLSTQRSEMLYSSIAQGQIWAKAEPRIVRPNVTSVSIEQQQHQQHQRGQQCSWLEQGVVDASTQVAQLAAPLLAVSGSQASTVGPPTPASRMEPPVSIMSRPD